MQTPKAGAAASLSRVRPSPSGAGLRLPPPGSVSVEPVCLFCPSEFEVNIVVLLHPDHLITENFPLKLCRM